MREMKKKFREKAFLFPSFPSFFLPEEEYEKDSSPPHT